MNHGNYFKLWWKLLRVNLQTLHLRQFIKLHPPGVVANGQPHLRWERHRPASPTRPNDTVPGVSVVFPVGLIFGGGFRFSELFWMGFGGRLGISVFKKMLGSCVE